MVALRASNVWDSLRILVKHLENISGGFFLSERPPFRISPGLGIESSVVDTLGIGWLVAPPGDGGSVRRVGRR